MSDRKPFKVDNIVLQNAPRHSYPAKKRSGPEQFPLPGIGAMTALEECVIYACYYFFQQVGDPEVMVEVSMTEFAEQLAYERREAGQEGYLTFDSGVYQEIYDALFRLYSASRLYDYRRKGQDYYIQTRLLVTLGLRYPGVDSPEASQEAVNMNPYSENFAVWALPGRKPNGLVFQLSPALLNGVLGKGDHHMGYSLMPPVVFELRHTPGGARISTRLLAWVIRQVSLTPAIHIDKLRKQLGIPGRNVSRDREGILKGLQLLKDREVIESFEVDRKNIVRIRKPPAQLESPPPAKA